MNILALIQKRYTAKKYNAHKAIPQEKIEELKEILRLTPSSINIQPWKFTFVQKSGNQGEIGFRFDAQYGKNQSSTIAGCV